MKPREYCCCAIPLVNVGIYAILTEQFTLGILVGTLSVATPSIVGAVTPVMAPWILGILAYAGAGVQVLGFIGVAQEKPITFRRYVTLHLLTSIACFSIAVVWIITSATQHSTAQSRCEAKFFATTTSDEGKILCNIFPWVDVGIMAGLWLFLAAVQFYFHLAASSYSSAQERDHANFDPDYDASNPLTGAIPLTNRKLSQESVDDPLERATRGYGHLRQESGGSDLYNPYHQPKYSIGDAGYEEDTDTLHSNIPQPQEAHTQDLYPITYDKDLPPIHGDVPASVDEPKADHPW